MIVFRETLRRGWRGMALWGIGFGLIGLTQSSVLGDVDALKQFGELVASMPPFITALIGSSDAAFLTTPEGFLSGKFYSVITIVFAVYGVMSGLNVTAVEEDRGILNSLMSTPLPRWRLMIEKLLAYALLLFGVVLLTDAGLLFGVLLTPVAAEMNLERLFTVTLGLYPLGLIGLAFTAMIAGLIPNRATVTGIAFGFVIGSYFINYIGGMVSSSVVSGLSLLSFFSYFDAIEAMQNGLTWGSILLLLILSIALIGVGAVGFQRRDIAA
jgi:ABC-2 type transport system permease protein